MCSQVIIMANIQNITESTAQDLIRELVSLQRSIAANGITGSGAQGVGAALLPSLPQQPASGRTSTINRPQVRSDSNVNRATTSHARSSTSPTTSSIRPSRPANRLSLNSRQNATRSRAPDVSNRQAFTPTIPPHTTVPRPSR